MESPGLARNGSRRSVRRRRRGLPDYFPSELAQLFRELVNEGLLQRELILEILGTAPQSRHGHPGQDRQQKRNQEEDEAGKEHAFSTSARRASIISHQSSVISRQSSVERMRQVRNVARNCT
jgi:hypothetical protein